MDKSKINGNFKWKLKHYTKHTDSVVSRMLEWEEKEQKQKRDLSFVIKVTQITRLSGWSIKGMEWKTTSLYAKHVQI